MINPATRKKRLLFLICASALVLFYIVYRRAASDGSDNDYGYVVPDFKAIRNKALASEMAQSSGGNYEPLDEIRSLLLRSPVVVFSKSYCPHSRFVKNLLKMHYKISPEPLIKELDLDPHGPAIQDALLEISGRRTVPNVFVGGKSLGGGDEIRLLHGTGRLITEFKSKVGKSFAIERVKESESE
ncbi:thioredoxin-like protein [Kockiozyma suomiensis]|uniref:thioredoxin-like protein n=1 Tax=Kockiozyma suomiensis TaxID=1337062 RepID=UPI003343B3CB